MVVRALGEPPEAEASYESQLCTAEKPKLYCDVSTTLRGGKSTGLIYAELRAITIIPVTPSAPVHSQSKLSHPLRMNPTPIQS